MTVVVALLALAVALLTVLVAGLLRSHATILRRLHELGAGAQPEPESDGEGRDAGPDRSLKDHPAPPPAAATASDVVGTGLDGSAVALRTVGVEHDTLLVFLSSGCATCRTFWTRLASGDLPLPGRTRLVVVARDRDEEDLAELARVAPSDVPVVLSSQAWRDHDVPGSPYVVHVEGATGRVVGQGTAPTWNQVARLLARATGDLAYLDARSQQRKARGDRLREADSDRALLAAGFLPGDPRLYPPGASPDADDRTGEP